MNDTNTTRRPDIAGNVSLSRGSGDAPPTNPRGTLPRSIAGGDTSPLSPSPDFVGELIHWLSQLLRAEQREKERLTALQGRAGELARSLVMAQIREEIRRGLIGETMILPDRREVPKRWFLSPGTVAALAIDIRIPDFHDALRKNPDSGDVLFVAAYPSNTAELDLPHTPHVIAIVERDEPLPSLAEALEWDYLHAPDSTVEAFYHNEVPY